MKNRENMNNGSIDKSEGYASAPAVKFINGQRHVKVAVPFGEGFAYKPEADAPSHVPMADKFRAAIAKPQSTSDVMDIDSVSGMDRVELLERALRGHDDYGQKLKDNLDKTRAQIAIDEKNRQAELDQIAYLELVSGAVPTSNLHASSPPVSSSEIWTTGEYDVADTKPSHRKIGRRQKISAIALAGVIVTGGGVAAASNTPDGLLSAFIGQTDANLEEDKEVLPLPTTALVDSFAGCLDESGAGVPLIELSVTSKAEVNYTYTSSKNTPKILETNIHDENDVLVKAHAKPVIMTSNAPAKVTACVIETDRGAAVTASGDTVTVDLSKISPQLYQDVKVSDIARGFAVSDTVADPLADLWPVSDIVEGNVEAGKARPDTEEKMTSEIAAAIMKNYNDNNNIVAEIRQAQVKTAEALIRPGGGYAEKINTFLKEKIVANIKTKALELKQQGLTGIESPNVVFVSEPQKIVEKNPDAPKADSFKLADAIQITSFPNKLTVETGEVKK